MPEEPTTWAPQLPGPSGGERRRVGGGGGGGAARGAGPGGGPAVTTATAATARARGRRVPLILVLLWFDWRGEIPHRGASTAMRRLKAPGHLALNRRIPD